MCETALGGEAATTRLIGVAVHAQTYETAKTLTDLRPHLLDEIEEFFHTYNKLRGRKLKALAKAGPHKARAPVDAGMKPFKKARGHK